MKNYLREISFDLSKKEGYPFNLPIFQNSNNIILDNPITFIVGENGSGKSTLLENLAAKIGFNTLGGNSNHFYYDKSIKDDLSLVDNIKLSWNLKTKEGFFFRAESFMNFIEYVDELANENGLFSYNPYGCKSLQKQSHGESFLSLFKNKFKKGIFVLDEPEAALSPQRQLTLISIINDLATKGDCQFIIATHSPILISCPQSTVFEIKGGVFNKIDYKNTEQFQIYKTFTENPNRYLKYLIADPNEKINKS